MGGGHGRGDLADHLVRVVRLQRPGGEHSGQLDGVGKPLVHDVDEVVLLDGVEDLDEARVAEQRRGTGGGQHRPGARVVRGQDVHADGAAQLLVHGAPAAESVQTGDALFQTVPSGQFVAAVQFGVRCRLGGLRSRRSRVLCPPCLRPVPPPPRRPWPCPPWRSAACRRCCLPRRRQPCSVPPPSFLPPHPLRAVDSRASEAKPIVPTVRRYARHTVADDGCARPPLSAPGVRAPCRPVSSAPRCASVGGDEEDPEQDSTAAEPGRERSDDALAEVHMP